MTLSSADNRDEYTGTGSVDTYPYNFKILAEEEVLVSQETTAGVSSTLVLNTDYTVTGVGNASGGNIVLTSPLTTGYILVNTRNMDFLQGTDLGEGDNLPAEVIESSLDKLTMMAQQNKESFDRSMNLPITAVGVSTDLPAAVANAALGWNAAANAIVNIPEASTSATAALASAADAAASETAAAISAASINLPSFTAADVDSSLEVNAAGSGYDLIPLKERVIRAELYSNLFI